MAEQSEGKVKILTMVSLLSLYLSFVIGTSHLSSLPQDVSGKADLSKGVTHHQSDVEKKGSGIDNLAAELSDKV